MGKGAKPKKKSKRKAPKLPPSPLLKVKVVAAAGDLTSAMSLVKPALLYADQVTILSPVAWMLHDLTSIAETEDPLERLQIMLALMEQAPDLLGHIEVPDGLRDALPLLVRQPNLVRAVASLTDSETDAAVDAVYRALNEFSEKWKEFSPALSEVRDRLGGSELANAVKRKLVTVDDVTSTAGPQLLADTVHATQRDSDSDWQGTFDGIAAGFLAGALGAMSDPRSLPLFDADASGLIRAFEAEFGPGAA